MQHSFKHLRRVKATRHKEIGDIVPSGEPARRLDRRLFVAGAASGALILPSRIAVAQQSPPIEQRGDPADEPTIDPEPTADTEPEAGPTTEPEAPSSILEEAELAGDLYFAATGHNLGAPFVELWTSIGGEEGPGLPLSEARFVSGAGIIRQDFEALALIYDPAVEQPATIQAAPLAPADVNKAAAAKDRDTVSGCDGSDSSCQFFADTGHTITGDIAAYWDAHVGEAILGSPLSEVFSKSGVTSQVFERAVVDIDRVGKGTLRKINIPIAAAMFPDDPSFLPAPPTLGTTSLVTASDGLRIRAKPSMAGETIAVIPENAEFIAAPGEHDEWVPGYADGVAGWVSSQYLKAPPMLPELAQSEWRLDVWQGAALSDTDLRRQPQSSSASARFLAFGDPVTVVDWVDGEEVYEGDGIWAQAEDGTFVYGRNIGRSAPVQPPPLPPDAPKIGKWIDVHLTQQLLVAYEGWTPVRTMVITTGKPGWETPQGFFQINTRVPNETMDSGSIGADQFYKLEDVLFTQYFTDRGHALHFAWWKTPETIGRPGSHGCINLLLDDSRFLWDWARIGTPVNCRG